MCGPPPDDPLCDECRELLKDYHPCEVELCADCQELLKHFCFCCGTRSDEPIGDEGVCKSCLEEQNWYKEDDHEEAFEEIRDSEEEE